MDALLTIDGLVALVTLSAMEIVLGIDNIVFIAILTAQLPPRPGSVARQRLGLAAALLTRIALLFAISWMHGAHRAALLGLGRTFSGRDLILLGGGLFLIAKATMEIHDEARGRASTSAARAPGTRASPAPSSRSCCSTSSSRSTRSSPRSAWPSTSRSWSSAMVIAVVVMLVFAGAISGFVERHPTVKMLALSFLLLIGVMLVAEGWASTSRRATSTSRWPSRCSWSC